MNYCLRSDQNAMLLDPCESCRGWRWIGEPLCILTHPSWQSSYYSVKLKFLHSVQGTATPRCCLLTDHSVPFALWPFQLGSHLIACLVGELWSALLPCCLDPLLLNSITSQSSSSSPWLHSYSWSLRFFSTLHSSPCEWESALLLTMKNSCFLGLETWPKSLH